MKRLVSFGYPLTMGLVIAGVAWTDERNYQFAWLAVLAASGMAAVAFLERLLPFERRWQRADRDFPADVAHAIVNLLVMHGAILGFAVMRDQIGWSGLWWPSDWPFLVQVLLAGLPLDLSLYAVHRLSHRYGLEPVSHESNLT